MKAALLVLMDKGFHAATIDEIAETAGVGKGTIYFYFPSKVALVEELIDSTASFHFEKVKSAVCRSEGAQNRLIAVIDRELDVVERHSSLARSLLETESLGLRHQFKEQLKRGYTQYADFVADIIREGQREGVFGRHLDPRVAASMIMGLRITVIRDWALQDRGLSLEAVRNHIVSFVMQGLSG